MTAPLVCPNRPQCPHGSHLHDIYELGDPYPTCCVEGCPCGHPGEAVLQRHIYGIVTVIRAAPVLRVARSLVGHTHVEPWVFSDGGERMQLDTAGAYRYELLRTDDSTGDLIYGRVA